MSPELSHDYIDSDRALVQLCQELDDSAQLAFDSEFIRTDTFFPKPGLYQVNDGDRTCLIDPLAIEDWRAFKILLSSYDRVIIMHSCGEDLGLLRHALATMPGQLFDTQRAASIVGYDYSLGYQALVKAELDVDLPKGETRSDWLRRPLASKQLNYAALDVLYLGELRERLLDKMDALDRLAWFESDSRDMLANVVDEWDRSGWETAYLNIGAAWQLEDYALQLLQKLAYWREATARERDKPRNWIAKDQEILTLASRLPAGSRAISEQDVEQADVFSSRYVARNARSIADFLNSGYEFLQPPQRELLSRPLSNRARKQLKALQKLTRELAEKLAISPELLARKRLWVELLEHRQRRGDEFWPDGLDNWRREILEDGVREILASVIN